MSLEEIIEADFKKAFKEKEQLKLDVLRLLKSALKNQLIEKKTKGETGSPRGEAGELSDEEAIKVIKKEIKKREESIITYQRGQRQDLADKESAELVILKNYAPVEMGEEELKAIVEEIIRDNNLTGTNNFGQAMKLVMAKVGDGADGKKVSALVKEKISG
jgi:uncharacterized protein